MSSRYDSIKLRLLTVQKLRLIKKSYAYSELAKYTGLPEAVLCRYVKGSVLPSEETAIDLWNKLENIESLSSLIKKRVRFTPDGFIDVTEIICDPYILSHAAQYVAMKFAGRRISKIMTAEINGITLATAISVTLEKSLVIAKRNKEVGIRDYLEEAYPSESSAELRTLYIPKGIIKSSDEVLVVDDIVRTGRTLNALINLIKKSKGKIEGIFVLMEIGKDWRRKIRVKCPIETAVTINSSRIRTGGIGKKRKGLFK